MLSRRNRVTLLCHEGNSKVSGLTRSTGFSSLRSDLGETWFRLRALWEHSWNRWRLCGSFTFFALIFWFAQFLDEFVAASLQWGSLLYLALFLREIYDGLTLEKRRLPDFPTLNDASGVVYQVLTIALYLAALFDFFSFSLPIWLAVPLKIFAIIGMSVFLVRAENLRQHLAEQGESSAQIRSARLLGVFLVCSLHFIFGRIMFGIFVTWVPLWWGLGLIWLVTLRVFLLSSNAQFLREKES